jgi:hypothetical protein
VQLGFELSIWCFLGKHSTIWDILPVHFCFTYFSDRSHVFCPGLALNCDSPTYISWVSGSIDLTTTPGSVCWDRILLAFPHSGPKFQSLYSASWVGGIIGVHHHTQQLFFLNMKIFKTVLKQVPQQLWYICSSPQVPNRQESSLTSCLNIKFRDYIKSICTYLCIGRWDGREG